MSLRSRYLRTRLFLNAKVFNAGVLLEQPMEVILESFVQKIIAVASGEETKNEQNNVREIAIFKNGVTL